MGPRATPEPSAARALRPAPGDRLGFLRAAALVAAATALGWLTRAYVAQADLAMLYLLTVAVVATRFGRGPSMFAAALSVGAYDFFFVPPFFTFAVHDVRHVLTFAMLFGAGLFLSALTMRARRHELAARAEEVRSSLLSTVSHDLRTPLASITGAATTLRDTTAVLSETQRAELLDTICEEAERMERLVRDLLQMTRIDAGGVVLSREWVPLEEVVGSAFERLSSKLAGRAVAIDLPANLPMIHVDPLLLEQAFVNLLENAGKHTPPACPVEIRARRDDGAITIEVLDRGPGFVPGTEEKVFEKFYRGPSRDASGAGLGLAIVKGVLEVHGGSVRASNREGGGARIELHLPLGGTPPSIADGDVDGADASPAPDPPKPPPARDTP